MSSKEIEKKVRKVLGESVELGVDFATYPLEESLLHVDFNSVHFIKVSVGLETEFEFGIEDDELVFEKFETIKNIADFVEGKLSRQ